MRLLRWRKIVSLGILALTFFGGAALTESAIVRLGLFAAAVTLGTIVIALALRETWWRFLQVKTSRAIGSFVVNDAAMCFVADESGAVQFANQAARARLGGHARPTLAALLSQIFAEPSAVLFRLQNQAEGHGHAQEDVVVGRTHLRLSVTRVGELTFLWRAEEFNPDRPVTSVPDMSNLPLVTVGRNGSVLHMNPAARDLVGSRVKLVEQLLVTPPLRPGEVNQIVTADGSADCLVGEVSSRPGRQEYYFLPGVQSAEALTNDPIAFDALPVPLMKIAHSGEVLRANVEANRLVGRSDVQGRSIVELMEGLGRSIPDWLEEAVAGRAPNQSEFLRIQRDDREIFVQVTLKRMVENGAPALVAVLNDATELKTLEAQFVQSQKMQAIGQLAGGVAHDFNNLLTAISGHCDLLLLRHDQGDPDYGDLIQINQNANRAAALVGQLLAFSRKQTLRPEVLDLRETVSDMAHLLNRLVGERVTLNQMHAPQLKNVRADRRQLEQVMMNLVVNARDAMPGGGEIRIETRSITLTEPLERDNAVVPVGDYVVVKVIDEGCGIAPDKLQKVFEPFVTTKRPGEGTGLGLSTVYGIVKQTGGFIFIDSVVNEGTEFTLMFPANTSDVDQPAVEARKEDVTKQVRHGDGVVLLVEDEAPVRAFASRALRLRGYTVVEAESAEDALKTLEDDGLEVDLFVTDVVMPGLDGPTWVRKAREKRPGVGVVFVSGYAEESLSQSQARIPNSVFLPKPFSLNELTETVQRQLD
ncbi:hybrid sensor histidine kinase/response regulator [Pseudaestuariivita atlantica]|uniref:hybrid sensor histidine kinase/response regulator n=1 Tax=Pseudaestuariivita atlantica TaxID=1317121 RepID=UPI001F5EAB56|nr:ATP-binding protein [Pseudaestuariivita atlantica]